MDGADSAACRTRINKHSSQHSTRGTGPATVRTTLIGSRKLVATCDPGRNSKDMRLQCITVLLSTPTGLCPETDPLAHHLKEHAQVQLSISCILAQAVCALPCIQGNRPGSRSTAVAAAATVTGWLSCQCCTFSCQCTYKGGLACAWWSMQQDAPAARQPQHGNKAHAGPSCSKHLLLCRYLSTICAWCVLNSSAQARDLTLCDSGCQSLLTLVGVCPGSCTGLGRSGASAPAHAADAWHHPNHQHP